MAAHASKLSWPLFASALASVLLVACQSSSGGGRACASDAECGGRACVSGRCSVVVPAPDGGAALDGGLVEDGGRADGGASDGGATDGGGGCSNDTECGAPVNICSGSRCVAGCATTGCGSGRACDTATGRCGACNNDAECGAPASICESGQCVPGCTVAGCALRNASCSTTSGRCAACHSDSECGPPSTICDEGGCVPGCLSNGCASGACSPSTGRCGAAPDGGGTIGSGLLGANCQSDGDCQSGKCLELSVASQPFKICASLCCSEGDCPPRDSAGNGVGCIEFYGANFCLTDRIFAGTGVKLERSTNQSCGPTESDNWCRSGLCRTNDQGQRQCRSTCCSNGDCGAFTCAFRPGYTPGEIAHHVCELNLIGGHTNDPCASELECAAYMCIPLGSQPFCADTCCTARDCPSGWICTQVESGQERYSNLGMACIPQLGGSGAPGSACTVDAFPNECLSGLCAAGVCRNPCCRDADCGVGEACRAVDNGSRLAGQTRTGLVRVCLPR